MQMHTVLYVYVVFQKKSLKLNNFNTPFLKDCTRNSHSNERPQNELYIYDKLLFINKTQNFTVIKLTW